jgi:hypothetical protein
MHLDRVAESKKDFILDSTSVSPTSDYDPLFAHADAKPLCTFGEAKLTLGSLLAAAQ